MAPVREQPERILAKRLQCLARERAEQEARRIPWQRLAEARIQYIDWQEFYLWTRSILEVEDRIPEWLAQILHDRCPGFVEGEQRLPLSEDRPLTFRLEDWIENHIFGFAKQEGWFNAIAFYAIREPRYQRAEVCWSEAVERWRRTKPLQYPSLDEWKEMAARCDETAHLTPELRKERASAKLVGRERLAQAVAQYIDWEALAYWARPALELADNMPAVVAAELAHRCPGFLDSPRETRGAADTPREWDRLMDWIAEHCFQDAEAEGWLDAIRIGAQNHPRAIRTMEFSTHCQELWGMQLPQTYPPFERWRNDADSYIEVPAG